jgi:hypothetical protein
MHIPASYEYPNAPYFAEYLSFGEDENLFDVLKNQYDELIEIFEKAVTTLPNLPFPKLKPASIL